MMWKRFISSFKTLPLALRLFFLAYILVGIAASILANDRPIVLKVDSKIYWPLFTEVQSIDTDSGERLIINFESLNETDHFAIWPLIPFHPSRAGMSEKIYQKPLTRNSAGQMHLLGTNRVGEDVFAALIHGTRISLIVGLGAMLISLLIGLLIGVNAGYYGDENWKKNPVQLAFQLFVLFLAYFVGFRLRRFDISDAMQESGMHFLAQMIYSSAVFVLLVGIGSRINNRFLAGLMKKISIPLDSLLMRFMEVFIALPKLIVLLVLTAMAQPSIGNLVLIIGLTSWTGIARFARAETLRIREMEYVLVARISAIPEKRIIWRHIVPNVFGPSLVSFTYGIAGAILLEATLSFLGLGVPIELSTWGKMLAEGRLNFEAWWLIVFPGLLVFGTILLFNRIAESLKKEL